MLGKHDATMSYDLLNIRHTLMAYRNMKLVDYIYTVYLFFLFIWDQLQSDNKIDRVGMKYCIKDDLGNKGKQRLFDIKAQKLYISTYSDM